MPKMPCVGEMRTLASQPKATTVDDRRVLEIEAYSGVPLEFYGETEVIDLAQMKIGPKFPILMEHERNLRVGVAEEAVAGDRLMIRGYALKTEAANEFLTTYDEGFPWQASLGARITGVTRLADGEVKTVNGREVTGPAFILASELREVSVCSLGKDSDTAARALSDSEEEVPMADSKAPEKDFRAVVRELRDAFPDRTDFVLAQAEKGHTVIEAKAELADVLARELSEAKAEVARLSGEVKRLSEAETGVSFRAAGEDKPADDEPDTFEAQLEREWKDPAVRAEFMGDKEIFVKYREGEALGVVKIKGIHSKAR